MGNGYGLRNMESVGRLIQVTADGIPDWKTGGITLDWGTVPAVSGAAVTLPDEGTVIAIGDKYVRWGQTLCEINANSVYQYTTTATGGTRDLTVNVEGEGIQTAAAIAYNANAAAIQTALEALSNVAVGDVLVTGTTTKVITFQGALAGRNVVMTDVQTSLTGGTDTFTNPSSGSANSGQYGPYDAAATDGRQTLTRDRCFLVNQLVLEDDRRSNYPPVFDGGRVYKSRITDLAGNPTWSQLQAVMPRLIAVD